MRKKIKVTQNKCLRVCLKHNPRKQYKEFKLRDKRKSSQCVGRGLRR